MTEKKPYDAGDPTAVAKRKTAAQLTREREVAELQYLLSTYGGRAFIWRTMEQCGIYHDGFYGEQTHVASHASGKKNIGLWLLTEVLTADPNVYTVMRNEATARTEGAK